jgi:luciferase family oxidoreductase group 1
MIPFSILDLAPIAVGATAADALGNSLDLARHAEALGYRRFWLAEHHNMPGIASSATAVVVGYVAGGTKTIRVGSGGVMLPNHAPLVIAEQFGTLASLYPDRIDLGLGRAPGADQLTARALRRNLTAGAEQFPEDVMELLAYFEPEAPGQRIRAVPGAGLRVPIWLLGSSLFSAQLAAVLGLPFAFASHFAPAEMTRAVELYRRRFTVSAQLDHPHVMLAVNVVAAESDAEARRHFTSQQQAFVNLIRGTPGEIPQPIDDIDAYWTEIEREHVRRTLVHSIVGSPETVERGLGEFVERHRPDELMVTGHVTDHAARLRSYEIVAEARARLGGNGSTPLGRA